MAGCAVCHEDPCQTLRLCETAGSLKRYFAQQLPSDVGYRLAVELIARLSPVACVELLSALRSMDGPERLSETAMRLMHQEAAEKVRTARLWAQDAKP
jgi:hypothetical protein